MIRRRKKEREDKRMYVLKMLLYIAIVLATIQIGRVIASRYTNRYQELKECKLALSILQTNIEYTMKPIPEIFKEIAQKIKPPIAQLFQTAAENMDNLSAGEAWEHSFELVGTNLKKEDMATMKSLGKLLGKTDIEGQVKEIQLVHHFLDTQIQEAQMEKQKNTKLYKTLGVVVGMTIVILLV